jgi:DNA-binding MarR family transcriptional regulator
MMKEGTESLDIYRLLTEIFVLLDDADRRILRQYDLSTRQFSLLYHLDRDQGSNINELSRDLLCDKSNTTRLVERMKQGGLVTRQRDANDRRYVSVNLTEEGARLREEAVVTHQASVSKRFEILSPEEQKALNDLLVRLRNDLREQLKHA